MIYESITVEPVSPHIGAEIGNIDLTKPLPNNQVEELHKAFIQYQVIFFRDQKINFDDQIRLGRYFGPLGAACWKSRPSARPPTILMFESFITTRPRSRSPARIFTGPIVRGNPAARQHSL